MFPRFVLAFVLAVPPFLSIVARSLDDEPTFTLLVRMASSASGVVQVFGDTGAGYNSDQSASAATQASATARDYRLPLKVGRYTSLRIDPGAGPGTYSIEQVAVLDPSGRTHTTIPLERLLPQYHLTVTSRTAERVAFETTPGGFDPQIAYAPDEPLGLLPVAQSIPALARVFMLYVGIGFALLWVVQLALGHVATQVSKGVDAAARAASAHPHVAVLAAAAIATTIAMYPLLFAGRSLVSANTGGVTMLYDQPPYTPGSTDVDVENARGTDIGAMMWAFVPYSSVQRRALADGEWPLWNRYNGPGRPLWGQGQSLFLDPLHWLTFVGPDPAPGWDLKFAAHRLLLAWGVGVATVLTTGAWLPAALAASITPFVGFFAFRLNHPGAFVVTYAPWILAGWFLLARATTSRQRAGASLMLAVASALVLLSSPPKDAVAMLGVLEVTGLLALLFQVGVGRPLLRPLAFAIVAGVAALLLTMPHWLVFLRTLDASMTFYATPSAHFADGTFARALAVGPLTEGMPLPGLHALWLVFAVAAVVTPAVLFRQRLGLACLLGASIALAIAYGAIPESWLIQVPFVGNIITIHATFQTVAIVPLLIVSGSGAGGLLSGSRQRAVVISVAMAAASLLLFISVGGIGALTRFQTWLVACVLLGGVLVPTTILTATRAFPRVLPLAAGAALSWLLVAPGGQHIETGIVPLDRVLVQPRPRAPLEATSPIIDIIHAHQKAPARTLGLGYILLPGTQALYDLEGVAGPDALFLRHSDELMMAAGDAIREGWLFTFVEHKLTNDAPLLDMLNVGYLLAYYDRATVIAGKQALHGLDSLSAAPRPTAWPRAFFTDRIGHYETAPELIDHAREAGRPIAAIQDGDVEAARLTDDLPSGSGEAVPADRYTLTTNTTTFRVRAPRAGIVVLAETYMPDDFIATLNGRDVPYFRVNHAFKGVAIPGSGDWEVRFEYRPRGLTGSLFAAGAGALVLLALAAVAWRRPARAHVSPQVERARG